MHVIKRASPKRFFYVPQFAFNKEQLRRVLTVSAWRYVHNSVSTMPAGELDLNTLKQMSNDKFLRVQKRKRRKLAAYQRRLLDRHILAVSEAGGVLQFKARVSWLSWRCGWTSTSIAEATHTSPQCVRIILSRLVRIARECNFPTFVPAPHLSNRRKTK